MKSTRLLSLILAGTLLCTSLLGCAAPAEKPSEDTTAASTSADSAPATEPTGEAKSITLLTYGDKNDRMNTFSETVQKYVKDHGLNITVDLQVLPWSDYAGGQTSLKLASGEEFACFTDTGYLATCISKGYLQDVTDAVEKYGPNLKKNIDQVSFDAFSDQGKLYAIPVGNKNNASEWYGAFEVRQDLLEEAGMKEIKTLEDIEQFYDACIKLHPDFVGSSIGSDTAKLFSRSVSDKNMLFLDNSYFMFTDASTKDDKIYSYYESEEFKKTVEIATRWREKGLIDKTALSDLATLDSKFMAGQAMFRAGNAGRIWEDTEVLSSNAPNAKIKVYMTGADMPKISRGNYSTAFSVSANAKNPEAYVEFFNLIYENQESFDFFTYGEKGVDYDLDANDCITGQKTDGVFFQQWVTVHTDFMRFAPSISKEAIGEYKAWNDGAIPQKDIGFVFNSEPVKDIIAQLSGVYTEYCKPMLLGFSNYETDYPELLKRIKDAGGDAYIAEYQKQFSAFYNK
ncbi:MAG: extracellular solute-binding protein [Oscillospiraceae bacterium]